MKHIHLLLSIFILAFSIKATSQSPNRIKNTNLTDNIAIDGYDPVSYFLDGKAIEGKKEFAVNAGGINYYCSNAYHRDLLAKDYSKYEPQFGGWCAYAMGATGEKVEVDPETFKIVNGKLYLFYNAYFNNTLNSWNENEYNLKMQAENNWKKYN